MLTEAAAMRVLLVDDDEEEFILADDLLRTTAPGQYTVQWTSSYADALQTLRQPTVDAALIDYQLGIRSGLELIGELARAPSVPLILLTSQGDGTSIVPRSRPARPTTSTSRP